MLEFTLGFQGFYVKITPRHILGYRGAINWKLSSLNHFDKNFINEFIFQLLLTSAEIAYGLQNTYGPRDKNNNVIN